MDLGVQLPTSGALASPANIVRMAAEAERLGYAAVWTYERLLRPIGDVVQLDGGPPHPLPEFYHTVYEPLETLSHVAAVTRRIKLGTSIIDALFHPPVVLARRLATLDQLSNGRVIAGLGQGWMAEEFETANIPMKRRGDGMDEVIAAMRACWGPDPVSYSGRYYRIAPSEVNPKPVQPHLPVLIGAVTPAGIARAARIADGLNPVAFGSAADLLATAARFRDLARRSGRDPGSMRVVVRVTAPLGLEPMGGGRPFLAGSPQQIVEDLSSLQDEGIDHVFFDNITPSPTIDDELRLVEELKATATAKGVVS